MSATYSSVGAVFNNSVQVQFYINNDVQLYFYMRNLCNLIGLEQWY